LRDEKKKKNPSSVTGDERICLFHFDTIIEYWDESRRACRYRDFR